MSYTIKKYYKLSNIESFKNKYQQLINLENNINNNNKDILLIVDFNLNINNNMKDNKNIEKFVKNDFIINNSIEKKNLNDDNIKEKEKENNYEKYKKNVNINILRFAGLPVKNIEIYFDEIFNILNKEIKKIDIPIKNINKYTIYNIYNIHINLTYIGHSCINYIYLTMMSLINIPNTYINLIFYDESNEYFPVLYFPLLEYRNINVIFDNLKMYYFKMKDMNIKKLTLINTTIDNME